MANSRAQARIEARIRERTAYCLEFEINDPRSAFATVTRVEVTSDLSVARIFYTVLGSDADKSKVAHMLEGATGFIRKQVGRVLRTRRIPRLTWVFDDSVERQEKMEDMIAQALSHDREINPAAHPAPPPKQKQGPAEEPEAAEEEDSVSAKDRKYLEYLDARKDDLGKEDL